MTKNQFSILILLTILLCVTNSVFSMGTLNYEQPHKRMNEGWMIYKNGEMIPGGQAMDIRILFHDDNERGDVILLERTLDDLGAIEHPTLYMMECFTAMEVFIDGQPYKSYDMKEAALGKYVGWNNRLISLPADYAGHTIGLKLYVSEAGSKDLIWDVVFADHRELERMIVHTYLNPAMTGTCLIVLGILLLVISCVFSAVMHHRFLNAYTAVICILLGFAVIDFYGLSFVCMDADTAAFWFYASLMLCLSLSYRFLRLLYPPADPKAYTIAEVLTDGYVALRLLFHVAHVVSIHEQFDWFILVCGAAIVLMVRNYEKCKRDGHVTFTRKVQYVSFISCIGCMEGFWIFVRLSFIGVIPLTSAVNQFTIIILCLGPMLFLFLQCIDFLWCVSVLYSQQLQNEDLIRAAYEDVLTGLPNRAQIDWKVGKLEEKLMDYCVISIDLNDLKKVNDTYGHAEGDALLLRFGRALKKTFSPGAFCCRMGGDEFLAILEGEYMEEPERFLSALEDEIKVINREAGHHWKCSCAYGWAMRHEGKDWHRTYLLADQRMYQRKKQEKEEKR